MELNTASQGVYGHSCDGVQCCYGQMERVNSSKSSTNTHCRLTLERNHERLLPVQESYAVMIRGSEHWYPNRHSWSTDAADHFLSLEVARNTG